MGQLDGSYIKQSSIFHGSIRWLKWNNNDLFIQGKGSELTVMKI